MARIAGKKPYVIVTMNWSEDKWEEAYSRQGSGENIEVSDGCGYIIIKYFDKDADVQERKSDCIEFEDFR